MVQIGTLAGEGYGQETDTPHRQSLKAEFIERRVREGERKGERERQRPACLFRE